MNCDIVQAELVGYHFGVLSGEGREKVEAHLVGCAACMRAFVETKRAIELGEEGPAASEMGRARLRKAVARELGIDVPKGVRRWWEGPLAIAIAASTVLVATASTRAMTSGDAGPAHPSFEGRRAP